MLGLNALFAVILAVGPGSEIGPPTPLGNAGEDSLIVRELFTHVTHLVNSLTLSFERRRAGRLIASRRFIVGQCFGVPSAYCVGYYTHDLRKQLFVSTEMGEFITYLLGSC